ncbi:mob1 family protein [Niveomyces insectorum RCEF 264]|uniref:Mob1 family protein n=1 Tax=Niveomyces insectorum RCEF 264 TaxID=1081102 RepID=A0A167QXU9_9HYPO|nr:mob1 family protein [Niveomyces insectorum RCEF 264]
MALPPSSPRLPSPPPPAEIQIGPKSPAGSGSSLAQQQMEQQMEQTILDANAKRRIHPGTRAADFAVGPPLVPLNELDSAFQLQEHLAALHYFHTASNTQPITRDTARTLAQAPAGTDRTLWLYELCRFLIAQCNGLIVGFLFDTPPCSAATCPEMRASEWQFLCAVHEQPKSCCAIDYCCHTLDWAANVVTNPKIFPSRFVFADPNDKSAAVKNLVNVFRRLHRIFAHAWFQHRGVFWSVEGQTGLYVLFKTVCDMYNLLPAENYKLPPEAEGLGPASTSAAAGAGAVNGGGLTGSNGINGAATATAPNGTGASERVPGLLSVAALGFNPSSSAPVSSFSGAPRRSSSEHIGLGSDLLAGDGESAYSLGRTNTRRHIRSSPSTGSAVTTVLEQDEEGSAAGLAAAASAAAAAAAAVPASLSLSPTSSFSSFSPPAATSNRTVPTGVLPQLRRGSSTRTPAAHAAGAPSVTEREIHEEHEDEEDDNGGGGDESTHVQIDQLEEEAQTPSVPQASGAAETAANKATATAAAAAADQATPLAAPKPPASAAATSSDEPPAAAVEVAGSSEADASDARPETNEAADGPKERSDSAVPVTEADVRSENAVSGEDNAVQEQKSSAAAAAASAGAPAVDPEKGEETEKENEANTGSHASVAPVEEDDKAGEVPALSSGTAGATTETK